MFTFEKKPNDVALDKAISDILAKMNDLQKDSEAYNAAADNLVKLMNIKKEHQPSWRPSPDAIVGAAASIVGILFVIHHEAVGNVLTSKAISFVRSVKS